MTKNLFDQTLTVLLPEIGDVTERRALIESALVSSPVLHQIDWDGNADTFTRRLILLLNDWELVAGQSALAAVLVEIKQQAGNERQALRDQIDRLLHELNALPSNAVPVATLNPTPIDKGVEAGATNNGNSIPRPLLKYLCDRSHQEKEISKAFQDHLPVRRQRPIVCLIHGDVKENYSGFLERLKLRIFPKYLHLTSEHTITDRWLSAPARMSELADFWEALSPAFLGYGGGPTEKILDAVMSHQEPLMLKLHLDTETCKDSKEQVFKHLLEFWQAWPDLTDGRILINCVCLSYNRYPVTGLLDFTSRSRRKLNEQLKKWLTEKFNAEDYKQIIAVAVPELHAVSTGEVLAWKDDPEVKRACAISPDEVNRLFQRPDLRNAEGKIPTEILYPELAELLKGQAEPMKN